MPGDGSHGNRDDRDARRVVPPHPRQVAAQRQAHTPGVSTQRIHDPRIMQRPMKVERWQAEHQGPAFASHVRLII
jgi:hypothetical protein